MLILSSKLTFQDFVWEGLFLRAEQSPKGLLSIRSGSISEAHRNNLGARCWRGEMRNGFEEREQSDVRLRACVFEPGNQF